MKFLIASFVVVAMLVGLLAGCQPVSQDGGYRGGGSGGGSSSGGGNSDGGSGGSPTSIESLIPGTYVGNGYALLFRPDKTGNITGGSLNIRAASPDTLQTGEFNWSVSSTTVTIKMKDGSAEYKATYSTGKLTIGGKVYTKSGGGDNPPSSDAAAPPMDDDADIGGIPDSNNGGPAGDGIPGSYSGPVIDNLTSVSRLVIVASPYFENTETLKRYIRHKKRQGFDVKLVQYNGEPAEVLRGKLKQIYYEKENVPMAILLIGDEDSSYANGYVPAFDNKIGSLRYHATDFYYSEYTDDYVPEATIGRFSAINENQLKAQVDKVIFMEEQVAIGESSVTNYVGVSQELRGDQTTYVREYLEKNSEFTRKEFLVGNKQGITQAYNAGAGFSVYVGHGLQTSWNTSSDGYTAYEVQQLTNKNSYPVVIASTCYSGSYQSYSCMGEEFLRNPNGGAVAYIGASDQSFLTHNDRILGGNYDALYQDLYPGMVASLFHSPSMNKKYKVRTMGGVLHAAIRACHLLGLNASGKYTIEIYNLLGDPTYMPYTKSPQQIFFNFNDNDAQAQTGRNFIVYTAPDAQVAITRADGDDVKLIAAAFADESGRAVLEIPTDAVAGKATLYAIAQNYRGGFQEINIIDGSGTKSSNTDLTSIKVVDKATGATIQTFNQPGTTISFDVKYEEPILEISAITADSYAKVSGTGTTNKLKEGLNTIKITVTAENGSQKTYTLNITRKETTLSKNSNLKTLMIENFQLTENFNPNKYSYEVHLGKDTDSMTVVIEAAHEKAICVVEYDINVVGERNGNKLKLTFNKLLENSLIQSKTGGWVNNVVGWPLIIKVKSEFGTELSYSITVYRQ